MRFLRTSSGWTVLPVLALCLCCLPPHTAAAEEKGGAVKPGPRFESQIRPFLAKHCLACHSDEMAKGDLRLDRLSADFSVEMNRRQWEAVLQRVKSGEMPPKAKPRPTDEEIARVSEWVNGEL